MGDRNGPEHAQSTLLHLTSGFVHLISAILGKY